MGPGVDIRAAHTHPHIHAQSQSQNYFAINFVTYFHECKKKKLKGKKRTPQRFWQAPRRLQTGNSWAQAGRQAGKQWTYEQMGR